MEKAHIAFYQPSSFNPNDQSDDGPVDNMQLVIPLQDSRDKEIRMLMNDLKKHKWH